MALPGNVDIKQLWTGGLSFRRLRIIIDRLPEDSALWTEIRDEMSPEDLAEHDEAVSSKRKHGRWSKTNLLLASIADRIAVNTWQYVASKSPKGKAPPEPKPIPRPGVETKTAGPMGSNQRAYLERLRRNRGAVAG